MQFYLQMFRVVYYTLHMIFLNDYISCFSKNIPAAKRELSKLNKYSTPLGKLFCVKRVVNALTKPPKQSFINSNSGENR